MHLPRLCINLSPIGRVQILINQVFAAFADLLTYQGGKLSGRAGWTKAKALPQRGLRAVKTFLYGKTLISEFKIFLAKYFLAQTYSPQS